MAHWIEQARHLDDRLFSFVFGHEGGRRAGRRFFFTVSRSADGIWYLVAGTLLALALPRTFLPYLAATAVAFALEIFLYTLLKKSIRRPRPYRRLRGVRYLLAPPDEFSFPSGHTAGAFLMALVLSTAFPFLAVPTFAWACLVGFSRVYLGVHYPGDVLAGMVLGLSCAALALKFFLP